MAVNDQLGAESTMVDQKYISHPWHKDPNVQQYSALADTRRVDFAKGTKRDDVSFYKGLARAEEARRFGVTIQEYEKLIRMHKAGKFVVNFVRVNEATAEQKKLLKPGSTTDTKTISGRTPVNGAARNGPNAQFQFMNTIQSANEID